MAQALQAKHSSEQVDWVQIMLTIERPTSASLADCNRQEKFAILLKNAQHQRTVLLQWIQAHDLADEVLRIGPPTSLNLLFVQCTPHAAAALAQVPGVIDITLEHGLTPSTDTQ